MNLYYTKARLFPTLLTSLPLALSIYLLNKQLGPALPKILSLYSPISITAMYAALIYLCVMLNRMLAKQLFELGYYSDEIYFPTTTRILWNDSFYALATKQQIHDKILNDYGMNLPDEITEGAHEKNARKQISIAVSRMRNSLRNDKILLQHNIEYGFFRNLFGGLLLASLISLGLIIYAAVVYHHQLCWVAFIMLILHCTPLFFHRKVLNWYSNRYATILIQQFLSK